MRIFKVFFDIFKDIANDYADQAKHRATKFARKLYLYAVASFVHCLILGLSLFAFVERVGQMLDHPGGFFWTTAMTWYLFVSVTSGAVLYLISCRGHKHRRRPVVVYEDDIDLFEDVIQTTRRKPNARKRRRNKNG